MAVKLGATDISFRLGAITPTKVYFGAVEAWTDVVPTAPGIPTGLTVTTSETAESSVDVSWTAPELDGDSPITGYKVYRSFNSYDYTLHSSPSGTSAAVTVAYNGGQTIYIRVSAVNAIGEGVESEVTTGTMSDSAPGVPEGVSLSINGVGTLLLAWSFPAVDGGSEITGYAVTYQASIDVFPTTDTVGPSTTEYTLGPHPNGNQTYNASVAAVNAIGTGPASANVTADAADVPDTPSWMSASSSSSSVGGIDIGFTSAPDGGSPITQYDLEYDTGEHFSTGFSETISAGEIAYTLTGLQGGQGYYLRLRGVNLAGNGEYAVYGSNPVTASATLPGVPTGLSVTPDYANTEWNATWIEPSDGGSAITAYEIEEVDVDFFDTPTTASLNSAGTAVSWAVQDRDETRKFRIRAVNSVGNGDYTEYVESYYTTPVVLGAPTGLAGYNNTTLYWTDPDNGGSEIVAYRVYVTGTGDDATTYNDTDVTAMGTITDPSTVGGDVEWYSNSLYGNDLVFRVSAENGIGEGEKSDPLTYSIA